MHNINEILELKTIGNKSVNFQSGKFKIIREDYFNSNDKFFLYKNPIFTLYGWSENFAFNVSSVLSNKKEYILMPLISTGYYNFKFENEDILIYENCDKIKLIKIGNHSYYLDTVFNAKIYSLINARIQKENGIGIIIVPYEISMEDESIFYL